MESRPRSSVTMFIVIIAVILATVMSFGLLYFQNRPVPDAETAVAEEQPQEQQPPDGQRIVTVEGVEIALNPTNEFLLRPPTPEEVAPEGGGLSRGAGS